MGDVSGTKIDRALEADQQTILKLQSALDRTEEITKQMMAIFDDFERRLEKLETSMKPIHRHTTQMMAIQSNVKSTITSIEDTLHIYQTASRVEAIIRAGPSQGVVGYVTAMREVFVAIEFLDTVPNYRSTPSALSYLRVLQKRGVGECRALMLEKLALLVLYVPQLRPGIAPAQPTSSRSTGRGKKKRGKKEKNKKHEESLDSLMRITLDQPGVAGDIRDLQLLLAVLDRAARTGAIRDYRAEFAQQRAEVLQRFLQRLFPSLCAREKEDRLKGKEDRLKPHSSDKGNPQAKGGYSGYKQGSHRLIPLMRVLLASLQAERHFCEDALVDEGAVGEVMRLLASPALSLLLHAGEPALRERGKGDPFSLFPLLDVWQHLHPQMREYKAVFRGGSPSLPKALSEWEGKVEKELDKRVTDVLQDLQTDERRSIPKDGTVHELTSNIMNFLKRMFEYEAPMQMLLANSSSDRFKGVAAGRAVAEYTSEMISTLITNLKVKARGRKVLENVFLLNNVHFILRTDHSGVQASLQATKADVYLEMLIATQRDEYKTCWNKAVKVLANPPELPSSDGTVSKAEKDKIKASFKTFNSEIESLFETQKHYFIPSVSLREQLRTDIKELIVPLYKTFLQRCTSQEFTTNSGKYVRYSVKTLEQMLGTFFEGTAKKRMTSGF